MQVLAKKLPEAFRDTVNVVTVDGLGISLKEGWVLVRPSGTEPVTRITCEAATTRQVEATMKRTKSIVAEAIERTR